MTAPATTARNHREVAGLSAWAQAKDVVLCDVWGVVHDGVARMPDAVDALARFRAGGGTVVLVTNAPRPRDSIGDLLDRLGVPRESYDAIVSSGDVTVDRIVARGNAPVHHLGPPRDLPLFETAAQRGVRPSRVAIEAATYVVCTGLDRDTDQPEAYDPVLTRMRARDLALICANPDIVVHTGDALVWCAGALAQRYAAIGGAVTLIGKPHPLIYAAARAEALRIREAPTPLERMLAIGDGMFTDILGAHREGIEAILVTSGIHRDRIGTTGPDGAFTVKPAAYAALAREAGVTPAGHMPLLRW